MNLNKKIRIQSLLAIITILLVLPTFLNSLSSLNVNIVEQKDELITKSPDLDQIEEDMIELKVLTSELKSENVKSTSGVIYQRISIDGGQTLSEVGCPKVPFKTVISFFVYSPKDS